MYKKEFEKTSGVHKSSRKPPKKCAMKERKGKKRLPRKNFCGHRKAFIRLYLKNGWIDFYELRDIDSSNNEGTNCLVNGRIGRERMVRRA